MKWFIALLFMVCGSFALNASEPSDTESFFKEKLGLSELNQWFGKKLESFGKVEKQTANLPKRPKNFEFEWYSTPETKKSESTFPGKRFLFGFKDGRMAAIRIFTGLVGKEEKESNDELMAFARGNGKQKLGPNGYRFADQQWVFEYMPYCNSGENIFGLMFITQQPE